MREIISVVMAGRNLVRMKTSPVCLYRGVYAFSGKLLGKHIDLS